MNSRLIIAAASALALAACSTSHVDNPTLTTPPSVSITATAGGSPAPLARPCTLLTAADVRAAFGGTSTTGVTVPTAPLGECQWTVTGSKLGSNGKLTLSYPIAQSKAAFGAAKAGQPGATTIPEVGDDAYYVPSTGALGVLFGEHQFVVQGVFGASVDAADLQVDLIAVAEVAETRQ